MGAIISRFAPAPTGFLHLGHIVNALIVWEFARARGGRVLVRIEDHDRQRSRREFEAAIFEDLDWLGFVPDEPAVRQSDRGDIYLHALERLRGQGLVYACSCTRAEIARAAKEGSYPFSAGVGSEKGYDPFFEARYPGTCRDRGLADGPGLGLRVRLDPCVERFVDLRLGAQEQRPSDQCGDVLIRDRDLNWTYQFAATVDDYVQGVTHVIRGEDLIESTGRQLQLARLLGRRDPPQFLHHRLIMKSAASAGGFGGPGQKLSKSDGDTGVRDLRARGWSARQVIDRARELGV